MIINVVLLVFSIILLIVVSEFLIKQINILVKILRLPSFVISSIFFAFATSLPEFSVGIVSTINKQGQLSLGNILGANIANLSLIVGITCLLTGNVVAKEKSLQQDLLVTAVAGLFPLFFLWDYKLSSAEGLILIIMYIIYDLFLINKRKLPELNEQRSYKKKTHSLIFEFLGGLFLLGTSAYVVVRTSESISLVLGASTFLIGCLVIAVGTTLPELVVSYQAARKKEPGVLLGNILGSVVVNSTFILGLMAIISPLYLPVGNFRNILTFFIFFCFVLLAVFLKSKNRLERKEGLFLILFYFCFVFLLFYFK